MKRISGKPRELTPRMKQVVTYLFENPGLTQEDIGVALGISGCRVSQILHSARVVEAYPAMARRKIKSMVPEAVAQYHRLLKNPLNAEVSRKVAERILDNSKVLEPETKTIRHEIELMATDKVVERVRDGLKVSAENVFDTEIVPTDEETKR